MNIVSCRFAVSFSLLFLVTTTASFSLSGSNSLINGRCDVCCRSRGLFMKDQKVLEDEPCSPDNKNDYLNRKNFLIKSLIGITTATAMNVLYPIPSSASYIDPMVDMPIITKLVYLDVEFGEKPTKGGRIVIGLFGDAMPRTCTNFETLCQNNKYAGTTFYRVLSDYTIQGGAIGDTSNAGKTGQSSYTNDEGQPISFEPDNYNIKHTKAGLISMVTDVRNGGGVDSRFFINCKEDAGWADDRYAAFGIVQEGMELVSLIEKVDVSRPKNIPKSPVRITASGVL